VNRSEVFEKMGKAINMDFGDKSILTTIITS
jgi:hypothetical protein